MEWVFVKMMLSLAAVLGVMFGLVFVLKRFVLPGRPSGTARVDIDILGQRSLGPKRSIVVVKVLQQVLVVGLSETGDAGPSGTRRTGRNSGCPGSRAERN